MKATKQFESAVCGSLRLQEVRYFRDETISTFYPASQYFVGYLDFDKFAEYAVAGVNWLARRMLRHWLKSIKAPALSEESELVFSDRGAHYRVKITRKGIRIFASRKG